jgi:hypothetical protein
VGDLIPLDKRKARCHTEPWYTVKDLMARNLYDTPDGLPLAAEDEHLLEYMQEEFNQPFTGEMFESGFVFARMLPEDTYVPHEYVLACITTAVWWSKTVNVSWMQMDYQDDRGCEVPIQYHRKDAVVMYVDDDCTAFGIASPDDLTDPVRVHADVVTDIVLCDLVPTPVKPEPTETTDFISAEQARADKYVADLMERYKTPGGLQVDG